MNATNFAIKYGVYNSKNGGVNLTCLVGNNMGSWSTTTNKYYMKVFQFKRLKTILPVKIYSEGCLFC